MSISREEAIERYGIIPKEPKKEKTYYQSEVIEKTEEEMLTLIEALRMKPIIVKETKDVRKHTVRQQNIQKQTQ